MNETNTAPPVKLAELAMELGAPVDAIEQEIGADVFRHGGFRCCSAFRASELIAEHDRRKGEAAAEAERRAEESRRSQAESRARAIARKNNPTPQVEEMKLETTRVPGFMDAGALPVARMAAASDRDFGDGSPRTPRLTRMDWLLGKGADTGGTFGPDPRKRKKGA
jgi:hypothetical protein